MATTTACRRCGERQAVNPDQLALCDACFFAHLGDLEVAEQRVAAERRQLMADDEQEKLTCCHCNELLADNDVWDQDADGAVFHPECRDLAADTTIEGPMHEAEAAYAAALVKIPPEELARLTAEDETLRTELKAILDLPYFQRGRHKNRLLSIHYRLGYNEWVRQGKPQPQPRFV